MHVRQAIREHIVTAVTGLSTTGTNVYPGRVYPIGEANLPALFIYARSDTIDYQTISPPRRLNRTCEFVIEGYAKAGSNYDDTLDSMCSEIETALYTDRTRDGNAYDTRITRQEMDYSDGGDQPMSVVTLTVEVNYPTIEGSPEV